MIAEVPTMAIDLVEMDPDLAPNMQTPPLGDNHFHAQRGIQRNEKSSSVLDNDDPVAALALLWFAGALELDQVRTAWLLLAELEPAVRNVEVGVALHDSAMVLGSERPAYLKRRGRARVGRLQLDVSPRWLHDGRSRPTRHGSGVRGAL